MTKRSAFLSIVAILGWSLSTMAQAPDIQWQKCFGGLDVESAYTIQQTIDGGYIFAGSANSLGGDVSGNHGDYDLWVVKVNEYGNFQWKKCFGGTGYDEARALQQTSDGGYIITGYTKSNDGNVTGHHGGKDVWVLKLDQGGTLVWQKALGGTGDEVGYAIKQTADGGFIMAGETGSSDGDVTGFHGNLDYWVVKLDTTGTLEWQKALGGTEFDVASSIVQTSDNGYLVLGNSSSYNGDVNGAKGAYDFWLVKLDSGGSMMWQSNYGGSGYEYGNSIEPTSDNGFIMVGPAQSTDGDVTGNHGQFDYWAVKIDSVGAILWQKCYGGSDVDFGINIKPTADGGYVMTGNSYSNNGDVSGNHTYSDYWVVRIDATGNLIWQKCLGGTAVDIAHSVQETYDWGYIVVGHTKSNDGDVSGNKGKEDYWVVKLKGAPSVVENETVNSGVQIFPNPATSQVEIKTDVKLIGTTYTIYDHSGKSVRSGKIQSGMTIVDLKNLANGTYLVSVGEQSMQSIKLIKE